MSYISSYFYCVFSTKERRRLIVPELRDRLRLFLGGIARQNKMKVSKSVVWKTTSTFYFRCRPRWQFPRPYN